MPAVTEEHPRSERRRTLYPKAFRKDAAALVVNEIR